MNSFGIDSHLGAFHFGSNLMVALVKGPLLYFFSNVSKLLCSDLLFWFRLNAIV